MIENMLLPDLVADLPPAVRLQRLVATLRSHFQCGAVALLQLEENHLRPVAVSGLVSDALGRRFALSQHPRLAAILARRGVTHFHHDSVLPDPYDGLIDEQVGQPLAVHDCMGCSLQFEGQPWGVLTLDGCGGACPCAAVASRASPLGHGSRAAPQAAPPDHSQHRNQAAQPDGRLGNPAATGSASRPSRATFATKHGASPFPTSASSY